MAKPDVWMPLYVADYLADTGHLSCLEHGAYLLLIMHYWRNGGLPDDDVKLARIAKCTPKEWGLVRPTVSEFFADGWCHKRIDNELVQANENAERNAQRARQAAEKRWGKHCSSNAPSMPEAVLEECPSPSPSPSDSNVSTNVDPFMDASGDTNQKKAKRNGKSRTELSDDWRPCPGLLAFASELGLDPEWQTSKFRDHAKQTKRLCADWDAAYRNWCRKAVEFGGDRAPSGRQPEAGKSDRGILAIARSLIDTPPV